MEKEQIFINAFPKYYEKDIRLLFQRIDLIAEYEIFELFLVTFKNEPLKIPFRIYFQEVSENNLSIKELLLLNCIFTRHHNGFIRQKSLKKIISSEETFITPFVFQLLGEYVIQIIEVINDNLSDKMIENMREFAIENPQYLKLTKSRMISYWNCYYRHRFKNKEDYIGLKVLEKLRLQTK